VNMVEDKKSEYCWCL